MIHQALMLMRSRESIQAHKSFPAMMIPCRGINIAAVKIHRSLLDRADFPPYPPAVKMLAGSVFQCAKFSPYRYDWFSMAKQNV
jgi:hypothetical protein